MDSLITAIDMIIQHPGRALLVLLLFVVCVFIRYFVKQISEEFDGMKTKMEVWEKSMTKSLVDTQKTLNSHSEDMGKATKAMSGDLLKAQQSMFELKQQLIDKVTEVQTHVAVLERDAMTMAHALKLTTEQFDAKFGRIIEFKKELETAHGKILRLEESGGKAHAQLAVHEKWIGQIGGTLKSHRQYINDLAKKKGPNEI